MSLLGGIVHRDPARPVARPLLEAMAARVPGAGEALAVVTGPVGFFTADGARPPKRSEATVAAADLDLVNLAELRALTGLTGVCEVLARLFELEGWQGLRRLRGAFAVALWDPRQARRLARGGPFRDATALLRDDARRSSLREPAQRAAGGTRRSRHREPGDGLRLSQLRLRPRARSPPSRACTGSLPATFSASGTARRPPPRSGTWSIPSGASDAARARPRPGR